MDNSIWSPKPQPHTLAPNHVIEQIQSALLEQRLKPGDRLPPEMELASLFSVSRGSVRQAMKALETLGVLTIRPGDGTYVNTSLSEKSFNPLVFAMLISQPSAKTIADARYALERDILELLLGREEQVEEVMTQVPGVIRIENPFRSSQSKGRIVINSQKAMALGTSESAVAMQIYYLLEGMNATSVDYGDTEYDVVLEYPEGKYDDISALLDYPITTQTGQQVALRDISTVEYITTLPTITRQESPALRSAQMVSSILPSVVVISALRPTNHTPCSCAAFTTVSAGTSRPRSSTS